MKTQPKQCPHLNTVQHGDDKEIRTYCTDCNECIGVKSAKVNGCRDNSLNTAKLFIVPTGTFNLPN